jgi:hypothetical protein
MEMTTATCKVGSVLIFKMYFMPVQDVEGAKKPKIVKNFASRERACKKKEPGSMEMVEFRHRQHHGL